jgi:hypothetical protein
MSPFTTTATINLVDRTLIPSPFHTTVSMEAMVHRTTTLTCTDSDSDIPLHHDGTLPTPAQKALDILTNTTTKAVINWETHTWELLTTRHAPFGMSLSQQRNGKNWWMAVDSSKADSSAAGEEPKAPKSELAAMMESAREAIEIIELGIEMEESMEETEVLLEGLCQNVGLEVQLHALEVQQRQVSRQIRRGERRTRRQAHDSDCELRSPVVVDMS